MVFLPKLDQITFFYRTQKRPMASNFAMSITSLAFFKVTKSQKSSFICVWRTEGERMEKKVEMENVLWGGGRGRKAKKNLQEY